jgi:hypothetical protein
MDLAIKMTKMKFKNKRMIIELISGPRNVITVLDMENHMIDFSEHDEVTLSFGDLLKPLQTIDTIKKYLNNVTTVDVDVFDCEEHPRIVLKPYSMIDGTERQQRHTCVMCDESVMSPFVLRDYQELPRFATYVLTPDLINLFFQVAAHAGRYGKIYFRLKNGGLSIDGTDENNSFEDDHDCDFKDGLDGEDMVMCFDHENFTHLLNIIKAEMERESGKTFKIGFTWFYQNESGVIRAFSEEGGESEEYMLVSRPV